MSASESHGDGLAPGTTGGPISDPQRPHSPVHGGNPPRLVRCQYGQDPHPLGDDCVNVTDVWTDERLEAGLRRVFAAVDPPPEVEVKPTLVWQCTRCELKLAGNPRFCWGCGYTVYRPTWEQPGGDR